MKKFLFILLCLTSTMGIAKPLQIDVSEGNTTNVFIYQGINWFGVSNGTKVNMVIDGVKVTAEAIEHEKYDKTTYIKLPSAFVNKVIRKAVINRWVDSGKLKKCTANNLPLIVMQGKDVDETTYIHFTCKNKPLK